MAGLIEIAAFMDMYNMHGQHVADRSMTRYRHDNGKMIENNEISTGPGRWALGVPNAYGNAAFVPTATTINPSSGNMKRLSRNAACRAHARQDATE